MPKVDKKCINWIEWWKIETVLKAYLTDHPAVEIIILSRSPLVSDGKNGDMFINDVDNSFFQKENNLWVLKGNLGKSAYQIWLDNGNTGSQQDYLDSLIGADGTDANIDVVNDPIYDNMSVIEYDNDGVKTFKIGYAPYTSPTISTILTTSGFPNSGSYIQELGETIAIVPFKSTLNKGREEVTAAYITNPSALNAAFQGILDLVIINAGTQQIITVNDTNVSATTTYTSRIDDSVNQPASSRTLYFKIPFLFGASITPLVQSTYYSALAKIIESQGNKAVTLNGVSSYFYFMYPASYPDLTSILDGNGFEAISAFTKTTENVDMLSGVESMKIYKTAITDIPNQLYTFKF